jgi:outer membrane lipoprotein-sorting protein
MCRHIDPLRLLQLLCAVVALAAGTAAANEAPAELKRVMAGMSGIRHFSGRFVERKSLGLLQGYLETSGQLRYEAPDLLERRTQKPAPDTFQLQGDLVSGVQRNGETYSITLSQHPEIAALVEGIRATLAGDLATLEQHYHVDFDGAVSHWTLRLIPRVDAVRTRVSEILVTGEDAVLKKVEVRQAQGDHSEMMIIPDPP